ncbi:uncharacterized protein VTP21DRAFT_10797 [Calcarisporiella thermophila]|uniref:uncharacterized protein n=1 Tax=Calcarisporiella thermophila TaxID=911321 RepID=UPI003742358A
MPSPLPLPSRLNVVAQVILNRPQKHSRPRGRRLAIQSRAEPATAFRPQLGLGYARVRQPFVPSPIGVLPASILSLKSGHFKQSDTIKPNHTDRKSSCLFLYSHPDSPLTRLAPSLIMKAAKFLFLFSLVSAMLGTTIAQRLHEQIPTVEELTKVYNMTPHPEGGFYAESYRDNRTFSLSSLTYPDPSTTAVNDAEGKPKVRNLATAIYFLLDVPNFSAFHILTVSEELLHYYVGTVPLVVLELDPKQQTLTKIRLSSNPSVGRIQHLIRTNIYFAMYPEGEIAKEDYALIGTTTSPAFDFNDFALLNRTFLLNTFANASDPEIKEVIQKYTRE